MARLSRLIAGGFGLGTASRAPGTAASFAAALLGAQAPRATLGALAAVAVAAGTVAVRLEPEGEADPGWIVIDEIAGQWVALLGAERGSVASTALAFMLFRFFDGYKIGPVGWADRQGGLAGVMLDDLVAGALSAGLMVAAKRAAPGWWGWRW